MSKYDFYTNIELDEDGKVVVTETTDNTEFLPGSEFEFFNNVKTGGFNVSKGIGSSVNEISVKDRYEFFSKIKLDNQGNIKIKYK